MAYEMLANEPTPGGVELPPSIMPTNALQLGLPSHRYPGMAALYHSRTPLYKNSHITNRRGKTIKDSGRLIN